METSCFQYLADMNHATMNIWHMSPEAHVGVIPKSGIAQ